MSVAMPKRAHAILSASGSKRWLTCPPSAQLEQQFPEGQSQYAEEGTLAHAYAEKVLRNFLEGSAKNIYHETKHIMDNPLFSQEMLDNVHDYKDFAIERINAARAVTKDAVVLLEQRLDFSPWVADGFGTGDLVIIADSVLEIIDLKYGKGVPVSAEDNSQMMLYALGAVNQFGLLYDFDTVRMTIHQPRLDSISTAEISVDELLNWGEETVKPQAELAHAGEGEFCSGDHCRFCRAKATCRARADANLELARFEFKPPPVLSNDEIAEVLAAADELQSWATDIRAYALDQAENHGVKFPGWKLVEGRSNRMYADKDTVAKTLITAGFSEMTIYEKVLLGITAMEKMVGKKRFSDLLSDLIVKPPGKPTLVPESDKRPEISSTASAAADFQETA